MSILKQIFGENAYWQVNKDIAREVGVEAALILADIVSKWMFHKKNNPEKNGWFYNSVKQMTEDTTIKEHRQREAINILVAKGFIEVKIKGVPATRNFNVNEQAIIQYFEGLGTSCEKTEELVTPKSQNYNNNNNNNKKK